MTDEAVKSGAPADGRDPNTGKFLPGNPGRKPGSRNIRGRSALMRMEDAGDDVAEAAIKAALGGDTAAMRLVLEGILPARKDAAVDIELPTMTGAEDAARAMGALVSEVAAGNLAPSEAEAVARLIEGYRRTLETEELEKRLAALERRQAR